MAYCGPLVIDPSINQVALNWFPNTYGHGSGGGEFGLYAPDKGTDNFVKVFCLEDNEFIGLTTPYYFTLNTQTVFGGVGVKATYPGDISGVQNSYDPLSPATAWLYSNYRNFTLQNFVPYNYTNDNDANSMQLAIWWLENELQSRNSLDAKANQLVDAAVNSGWNNIGNVRVINLWGTRSGTLNNYTYSNPKQDQICLVTDFIIIPEPNTGLLLWLSIPLGLYFISRKPY